MSGLLGDSSPEVGTVLAGKYRITRLLGRGGMGAVFAAQHEMLGEEVAVKLMLAEAMRAAVKESELLKDRNAF